MVEVKFVSSDHRVDLRFNRELILFDGIVINTFIKSLIGQLTVGLSDVQRARPGVCKRPPRRAYVLTRWSLTRELTVLRN